MHEKCFSAWPKGKLRLFGARAQGRVGLIGGLPLCCLLAFSLPGPHLRPLHRPLCAGSTKNSQDVFGAPLLYKSNNNKTTLCGFH